MYHNQALATKMSPKLICRSWCTVEIQAQDKRYWEQRI